MADILVFPLHYEGAFNKNSLGAVSEAARLAARARRRGARGRPRRRRRRAVRAARRLRRRAASTASPGPEGLAQPVVDAMAQLFAERGFCYALFGGGLLGFEIGAGLAARLGAGVAMEVTGGPRRGWPAARASARSLATRRSRRSSSAASGIVIGRLNAFEAAEPTGALAPVEERHGRVRGLLDARADGQPRRAARRERRHRGRRHPRRGRTRPGHAEGFELCDELATALGPAQRGRGDPRGRRRRLVPLRRTDRPDREDGRAEAVLRRRDLRRDPAQGRHGGLGEHRRDQQGRQRADLRVLRPRHRRRPQQDPAEAHRGAAGAQGRSVAGTASSPRTTRRRSTRGASSSAASSTARTTASRSASRSSAAAPPGWRARTGCWRCSPMTRDDRGAPRRGAGRGDREGQGLRRTQPVGRGDAARAAAGAVPRPHPRAVARARASRSAR